MGRLVSLFTHGAAVAEQSPKIKESYLSCWLGVTAISLTMDRQCEASFSYRAIVFALKPGITLAKNLAVKKLLSYRSVIICEHPKEDTGDCEWNELHYHGIVESPSQYRFDADRVFNQIKQEHCTWFKSEQCKVPVNFLAYMQIPPKTIVYKNERNDNSDLCMLEAQITPELIAEVKERKSKRIEFKREGSNDIMQIKDLIIRSGAQSEAELLNCYHNDPIFENLYCKRTFSTNFKKALNFAIQTTLDKDYRDLCRDFDDKNNECMSRKRSADLIEKWCAFQGICVKQFALNVVSLMDRKMRKQNTIILEGTPNSGKTFIAKSICKACIFFGEVSQGSAGYAFMWQDCVNKRFIILNEPYFDNCMIEQLKIVLEGTGTFVHKKNCSDEYLRPTPVMITTNNPVWINTPAAESAIRARCHTIYSGLKSADFLKYVRKDLHPDWVNLIFMRHCTVERPVSPFMDEECTSRATDTVDLAQTSEKQTQTEDLQTSSTPIADNTTSNLKRSPKKKLTPTFLDRHRAQDSSETLSQDLFPSTTTSDNSQEVPCYQEENNTPLDLTKKRRTSREEESTSKRPKSDKQGILWPTPRVLNGHFEWTDSEPEEEEEGVPETPPHSLLTKRLVGRASEETSRQ